MKKVIIVLLLVAIMVLSMAGCGNAPDEVVEVAPAEVSENGKLEFEPRGTYNLDTLGNGAVVYRFESPNNGIVVYEQGKSMYLVGDDAGRNGTSYATMFIPDSEFIALSDEYLLFTIQNEKVAFPIDLKKDGKVGISLLQEYLFDELTEEEQNAFIYPVASELATY